MIVLAKDMYGVPKGTKMIIEVNNAGFNCYKLIQDKSLIFSFIVNDLQMFIDAGIVEEVEEVEEKKWTDKDMQDYGAYVVHNMETMHFNNSIILFMWYKDNVLEKKK